MWDRATTTGGLGGKLTHSGQFFYVCASIPACTPTRAHLPSSRGRPYRGYQSQGLTFMCESGGCFAALTE